MNTFRQLARLVVSNYDEREDSIPSDMKDAIQQLRTEFQDDCLITIDLLQRQNAVREAYLDAAIREVELNFYLITKGNPKLINALIADEIKILKLSTII